MLHFSIINILSLFQCGPICWKPSQFHHVARQNRTSILSVSSKNCERWLCLKCGGLKIPITTLTFWSEEKLKKVFLMLPQECKWRFHQKIFFEKYFYYWTWWCSETELCPVPPSMLSQCGVVCDHNNCMLDTGPAVDPDQVLQWTQTGPTEDPGQASGVSFIDIGGGGGGEVVWWCSVATVLQPVLLSY